MSRMQHCTQQIFEDLLTPMGGTLNQERKIISHHSKIIHRRTIRKKIISGLTLQRCFLNINRSLERQRGLQRKITTKIL